MHSTSFTDLHSLFRDLREGISCFFAISIPAFREARNAIGVFLKNAFSFLVQIRMQKEDSLWFHSLFFEIREWLLQNPAVSIPACQKPRNGFFPNKQFPFSGPAQGRRDQLRGDVCPGRRAAFGECVGLTGRSAASGSTRLAARPSLAMPLRRTPRAVNDRCRRKATPSEGSTDRSELCRAEPYVSPRGRA